MPDKFQNKYRIPSARLQGFDYGSPASYFVTICTRDRECFFGSVETPCLASPTKTKSTIETRCIPSRQLSPIGKIVQTEWLATPQIRPDMNLELDEFVVMPNHFHGIISICENEYNHTDAVRGVGNDGRDAMHRVSNDDDDGNRDAMHRVSTFEPQSKNLASIIRGFKSSVTTKARLINGAFAWQPRFMITSSGITIISKYFQLHCKQPCEIGRTTNFSNRKYVRYLHQKEN